MSPTAIDSTLIASDPLIPDPSPEPDPNPLDPGEPSPLPDPGEPTPVPDPGEPIPTPDPQPSPGQPLR